MRIVDPEDTRWETDYLGKILSWEEALKHPWLREVFDLSDRMVRCDKPINEFLTSRRQALGLP
ncbi:hypothetical protein [Microvirga sp. 2TAF3]|uniref:hypothetical protein n=1 Tax=Microvirga sp. 2TAF3 TaxID=3233014 RepID=UPI003F96E002